MNKIINAVNLHPERIIPAETTGGPLAAHMKRYDFARPFCVEKTVLDAACGVGYGSHLLAGSAHEIVGVDISVPAINFGRENYGSSNVRFLEMDVCHLTFPRDSFDVVCSFETIEHLEKPELFLSEVARVLRDDGYLLVSTPHVRRTNRRPKNPHHRIEYSRGDFQALLARYFRETRFLGQRRNQSDLHYYLQRVDVLNLRSRLPGCLNRAVVHATGTRSWDEAGLDEFVIDDQKPQRAMELIGVCRRVKR